MAFRSSCGPWSLIQRPTPSDACNEAPSSSIQRTCICNSCYRHKCAPLLLHTVAACVTSDNKAPLALTVMQPLLLHVNCLHMNLQLVDFHCFKMLQFQYFSSTARFSDSTYIDDRIVVFHLFCNCTISKHRKSTESEKRNWELRNIKPAPKSFEICSKSFAYISFSLLQMMKSLSLLALVAGAIAQKPAR